MKKTVKLVVVTLGLLALGYVVGVSVINQRITEAEQRHNVTKTEVTMMLQERLGTNWGDFKSKMNTKYGSQWTNEFLGEQWIDIHKARGKL